MIYPFSLFSVKAKTPFISGISLVQDRSTTTLTCTSLTSPLTGAIYLWKQYGMLSTKTSSNTHTTPSVTMSNHGDVYTCAVTINTVTSDDSSNSITLTGTFFFMLI